MLGDLHIHTTYSDGSYSNEEVIKMAKEKGLTHIAITNHDTTRGLDEALELGEKYGIKVIPGVEISSYDYDRKRRVHILGYNISLEGKNINKLCSKTLVKRNSNTLKQAAILIEEGYDISLANLSKACETSKVLYKQHIMEELINKHYCDSIYCELYYRLFKNNGVCAMDIEYVDAKDAVKAIVADGGIPVLAHPGEFDSYDIIESLVQCGLKGIEINHPKNTTDDVKKIKEYAEKFNLFLTGGTDYHGKYGDKDIELGDVQSPEEALKIL